MFVTGMLILWGWWFYFLSRLCFCAANTYLRLVSAFIVVPLGYQPLMALKQRQVASTKTAQQHSQLCLSTSQLLPSAKDNADVYIKQTCSTTSNSQHRVQQAQQDCITSLQQQDNLQKWFSDCATIGVGRFNSHSSYLIAADMHRRNGPQRTLSCAAAAAVMAVCGQSGVSTAAAAAAVGAAAILAQQLSNTDLLDSSQQTESSERSSSCCTVPPLMYDVSDELQHELDAAAPSEFLCPLSRTLMTDPVCTPSGFTYQRAFIEAHISKTGHDPARDSALSAYQLYPNIVLRDQIAAWLQKHGVDT